MGLTNVWIIPFCTFFFSLAAFIVSYAIAVYNGHVKAFLPYISDGGALPPESCIFGQVLNIAALFLALTVYLRHRQIVEFYWHRFKQVGRWRSASCILLWIGYASALGVSIVANFQENHVLHVHYGGALLAFGCGLIYTWAQTVLSYRMNPKLAQPIVSHCRMFLCMCSTFFFISMIVFGPILGRQPDENTEHEQAETVAAPLAAHLYRWTGNEPNYLEHVVGTCSEWLLAICFQLYILSFAIELREAYCHAPKLKLIAVYEDGTESSVSEVSGTSGCSPFACCIGGCGPYAASKTTLSDLESSSNIGSDTSVPTNTSHPAGTNVSQSVLFALDEAEKGSDTLPQLQLDSAKAENSVLRVKF